MLRVRNCRQPRLYKRPNSVLSKPMMRISSPILSLFYVHTYKPRWPFHRLRQRYRLVLAIFAKISSAPRYPEGSVKSPAITS